MWFAQTCLHLCDYSAPSQLNAYRMTTSESLHVLERKLKPCILPLYNPHLSEGTFSYYPKQLEMLEAHCVPRIVSTVRTKDQRREVVPVAIGDRFRRLTFIAEADGAFPVPHGRDDELPAVLLELGLVSACRHVRMR
jgi:hypothetical protein